GGQPLNPGVSDYRRIVDRALRWSGDLARGDIASLIWWLRRWRDKNLSIGSARHWCVRARSRRCRRESRVWQRLTYSATAYSNRIRDDRAAWRPFSTTADSR